MFASLQLGQSDIRGFGGRDAATSLAPTGRVEYRRMPATTHRGSGRDLVRREVLRRSLTSHSPRLRQGDVLADSYPLFFRKPDFSNAALISFAAATRVS